MALCTLCHHLDFKDLIDEDGMAQDITYHKSMCNLEQSAAACPLCRLFFDHISTKIRQGRADNMLELELQRNNSALGIEQQGLDETLASIWNDSPLILRGIVEQSGDDSPERLCGVKLRCEQ